ncbi:unnamed protein product [Oppiella nova]|uniref:KAT8 regulatory NSL complex subunit 3 n=1 Tax=Oppiella nova TaxID=334625 RepID=A0A7R9QBS7_9ACAR|nr:unnamed protein product [Oppiella nova]CAG2162103.1 unnamed protein product [Oppiella nova]
MNHWIRYIEPTMKGTEAAMDTFADVSHNYLNSQTIQTYLHSLSGQEKRFSVIDADHNYAKPWNRHPDAQIRAKAAKFLFMKNFPKHFARRYAYNDHMVDVDVETVDAYKSLPFLGGPGVESASTKAQTLTTADLNSNELTTPTKTGWTTQMNKLWTKATKILHSDRLSRLSYDSLPNEVILKKNLMERTTTRFRHLFASTGWDVSQISWLNTTLNEYVGPVFLAAYHEAMHILRAKIPTLIDKFYMPSKYDSSNRFKPQTCDAIQTMLNSYKPKRINGSPLFLIVPNGPQIPHQMTSQRMKHWHNLFGALGKVITISAVSRPYESVLDFLSEIRYSVRDKIKECKTTFNEGRPLVLVGFGHSSLVAAHCALDNASNVNATICLGFPLTAINGFRGDLDDPLLDTSVATLFVIGQNSTMATLDDMEDFRERITKTETGLVVVGGANDRLFVSSNKKKFEGITQAMVDRCIADEIYEFVSSVLNPSSTSFPSTPSRASPSKSTQQKSISFGVTAIPKPKRKRPSARDKDKDSTSKGRPRGGQKKVKTEAPKTLPQPLSSSTVTPDSKLPEPVVSIKPVLPPKLAEQSTPKQQTPTEPMPPIVSTIHSTAEKTPKPKAEDMTTPESTTTLSQTSSDTITTPKTERHYGLSYGISEMPTVISQSATRTGRQIRAPKSLDV